MKNQYDSLVRPHVFSISVKINDLIPYVFVYGALLFSRRTNWSSFVVDLVSRVQLRNNYCAKSSR